MFRKPFIKRGNRTVISNPTSSATATREVVSLAYGGDTLGPSWALFWQAPLDLVKGGSGDGVLYCAIFLQTSAPSRLGTELSKHIFSGTCSEPSSKSSRRSKPTAMPVRFIHRVEHGGDMRARNVLVKKITH